MRTQSIFINLICALLSVFLLAAMAVTLFGFDQRQKPNILVITVESTRFDAISETTTPFIWRMSESGHRFTNHRTVSAWTGSNIVSLLTGLSTFHHGVHSRDASIPESWNTPLDIIGQAGWDIGGVQSFMLTPGFQNLGLTLAPATNPFAWMAARRISQNPFLFWYHYLDTHLPYNPPNASKFAPHLPQIDQSAADRINLVKSSPTIPASAAAFRDTDLPIIRALYDAQFPVFDDWFKSLWTFLEKSGLRATTIVILTTDHGEELLERGHVGHASTTRVGHLYEEIAHIPMIIWLPPRLHRAGVPAEINALSSHIDIMPTLFKFLDLEPDAPFEGADLFQLPRKRVWTAVTSKAGFAEKDPSHIDSFVVAIVDGDLKAQLHLKKGVVTKAELYNLLDDPMERKNLANSNPTVLARLSATLMPRILSMRIAKPDKTGASSNIKSMAPPQWAFPINSGILTYNDLPAPFMLKWRGAADADYLLQYKAGDGPMTISGKRQISGLSHNFGAVSRHYWNEYIIPYKRFSLRIRYVGQNQQWSPWLDMEVRK